MDASGPSLDRLADELGAIGQRLAGIGSELRVLQEQAAVAPHRYVPAPAQSHVPLPAPSFVPPPAPPVSRRPGFLEREGASSRLLAWVGGSVTLLGILLLLVLAVQRGWLGPLPRVLGGAALGLALVGVALWVHRSPGGRAGGITLAATGVAALYLDVVAATVLYGYLPTAAGLAGGVLVACGGLLLAHRWTAQPLAVAVVAGAAVLAPVITGVEAVPLVGFLLVLQLVAVPVQLRHRWSALTVVAAAPPVPAGLLLGAVAAFDDLTLRIALMVPAVTVVALAVAVLGAVEAHRDGGPHTAHLAVLAASPAPVLLLSPSMTRPIGASVVGVLAAVLLGLWIGIRFGREVLPRPFGTLCGGLGALSASVAIAVALDGGALVATVLGVAAALAVTAQRVRSRGMLGASAGFAVTGVLLLGDVLPLAALAQFPEAPFLVAGGRDVAGLVGGAVVGLLLAAVSLAGPWSSLRLGVLSDRPSRLAAGIVGGLGVLYGLAGTTLATALLVLPDRTGFLTGTS